MDVVKSGWDAVVTSMFRRQTTIQRSSAWLVATRPTVPPPSTTIASLAEVNHMLSQEQRMLLM
jgi:hypothetical protein